MTKTSSNTVVFLHGFTGSQADWSDLREKLSTQYKTEALDIIGHGERASTQNLGDYDMAQVALQVKAQCPEQLHLVGYSMGGRLALCIATQYPDIVQSLTLISASPGLKTETERQARRESDDALADKIEASGIEWFADYWGNLSLWDSQLPELKADLRQKRLRNNPMGLANSLRGMGTGAMPSLWDKLSDLPMPVQLIVGELDKKFVAINQEMADSIPNVGLEIIKSAGHAVHLEQPETVIVMLKRFLNSHKNS